MSSLTTYFETDFNTQREEWEKTLLAELKLAQIGDKALREIPYGASWSTLSLERKAEVQLCPSLTWKKASTTYTWLAEEDISTLINEDLKSGVKNFFFSEGALDEKKWQMVQTELLKDPNFPELEIFFLGKVFEASKLKTVSKIIAGRKTHHFAGNSVQELGEMAATFAQEGVADSFLGVFVDSQFFQNIAKIRAARLLANKICEETGRPCDVKIVALTSYTDWTLFERYSNMLRNQTAVASAYIGGADHIQSSGYNTLIELETEFVGECDHFKRSQRMARNTAHILGLESMLGVVLDAAHGSYHLENLTHDLCEKSWNVMQRILKGENLAPEMELVRDQKLMNLRNRKTIISGINDFPDATEELKKKLKQPSFFRPARAFEEVRLKMEKMKKPDVYVLLYGDYGALNARLNFAKNYFELLGLKVLATGQSVTDSNQFIDILNSRNESIITVCAADSDYPLIAEHFSAIKAPYRYIAGKKFQVDGFTNIFAGQDVYEVLENLVKRLEGALR